MATQQEVYDRFLKYFNEQMATVAHLPARAQEQYAAQLNNQYYQSLDRREKEQLDAERQDRQDKQNLVGIGTAVGGPLAIYGGKQAFKAIAGEAAKEGTKQVAQQATQQVGQDALSSLANTSAGVANTGAGAASTGGQVAAPKIIGASRLGADAGTTQLGAGTVGTVLGAAAAAKGGYDAFKGMQEDGGKGVRSGLTTMGAGIGSMILPGLGTAIGAAGGNALGYGLQGDGWKNDLALTAMTGGIGAPLMFLGGGDFIRDNLIRKTTKQYQQEGWDGLSKEIGADNPTAQYIADYQNEINNPQNTDPKRFEEMQGLDLTPGKAFFDTFGRDWLESLNEEQRIKVAQEAKDRGLINSRKGDIVTSDASGIKSIADEFYGPEWAKYSRQQQDAVKAEQEAKQEEASMSQQPDPMAQMIENKSGGINPNVAGIQNLSSMGGAGALQNTQIQPNAQMATPNLLGLAQTRPVGFDEDPNNPGRYIRR